MKTHTRWFGHAFLFTTLMSVLVACPTSTPNPAPSADTTKPTVSLGTTSTTITTAGSITLTATASDNVGVTKVEFFDGANKLDEDSSAGDGFTQTVTLALSSNGQKSYTAKAFDAAGNTQTSAALVVSVSITVPPVDTTRPTLVSSQAISSTSVQLVMSEPIVGRDVASNFKLTSDGQTIVLAVTAASVSSDKTTVTLTTATQTKNDQYLLRISNLTDLVGNPFDETLGLPYTIIAFSPVP